MVVVNFPAFVLYFVSKEIVVAAAGSLQCAGQSHNVIPGGFRPHREYCFCLYAGQCLSLCGKQTLRDCQMSQCGEVPLETTESTSSFYPRWALHVHEDVLTIPKLYFHDISALKANCADSSQLVASMLEAGRRVWTNSRNESPKYQCIHLPGGLSIGWLHLHTFSNTSAIVARELEFNPDDKSAIARSVQICINASMPIARASRYILSMADVCMTASIYNDNNPQYYIGAPAMTQCRENSADLWNTSTFPVGQACTPTCPSGYVPKPSELVCRNAQEDRFRGVRKMPYECVEPHSNSVVV